MPGSWACEAPGDPVGGPRLLCPVEEHVKLPVTQPGGPRFDPGASDSIHPHPPIYLLFKKMLDLNLSLNFEALV